MNQEGEKGTAPLPAAPRWASQSSAVTQSCWTRARKQTNSKRKTRLTAANPATTGAALLLAQRGRRRTGSGQPRPHTGSRGRRPLGARCVLPVLSTLPAPWSLFPGHVLLLLLLRAGSCSPCEIAARVLHPVNPLYCHPRSPPCPLHPCPRPRWPAGRLEDHIPLFFFRAEAPRSPRTPRPASSSSHAAADSVPSAGPGAQLSPSLHRFDERA